MSSNDRRERVAHALRDVLSELIRTEVKDPRVRAATLITIAKVEMNVDISVANVYVSVVGDDATADGVVAGLQKAAGFLRGPVARRLRLQHAPELRFARDVTIDMSEKLASIIRDDEQRARAAGRVVENSVVPEKAKPAPEPEPVAELREDERDGGPS